jgi:hypothetical protein
MKMRSRVFWLALIYFLLMPSLLANSAPLLVAGKGDPISDGVNPSP